MSATRRPTGQVHRSATDRRIFHPLICNESRETTIWIYYAWARGGMAWPGAALPTGRRTTHHPLTAQAPWLPGAADYGACCTHPLMSKLARLGLLHGVPPLAPDLHGLRWFALRRQPRALLLRPSVSANHAYESWIEVRYVWLGRATGKSR